MDKRLFRFTVLLAGLLNGWALYADTWAAPTQEELIGVWEGAQDIEIPENTESFYPGTSIRFTVRLTHTAPQLPVHLYMKIDMGKFLTDFLQIPLIKAEGHTKETLWAEFSAGFAGAGKTIGKYYVAYEVSEPVHTFLTSANSGEVLINTNKMKLKLIFNEVMSFGLGDKGFREMILTKAQTKR